MSNNELLIKLRDLHEQLAGINLDLRPNECVDDETIDALGQLVTDVGSLVDRAKHVVEADEPKESENSELVDRVRQFESEHPRVTSFLSQMTDVLAMLGI